MIELNIELHEYKNGEIGVKINDKLFYKPTKLQKKKLNKIFVLSVTPFVGYEYKLKNNEAITEFQYVGENKDFKNLEYKIYRLTI